MKQPSDPTSTARFAKTALVRLNSRVSPILILFLLAMNASAADSPKPASTTNSLATFGGGCFWCLEAVFERLEGVKSVTSGFAGGRTVDPTYKQVCEGDTGHAEVVQIAFDPAKITYAQLLDVFWESHDPTTLDRQGPDQGTQYRSIILTQDDAQKQEAGRSRKAAAQLFKDTIVTEIVPLTKFYSADAYHQDFFRNNSRQPYCAAIIAPKLKKLEKSGTFKKLEAK